MIHNASSRSAFTLVELMVTTSAITLLGSMSMLALKSATSAANVSQAKAEASAEARAVTSFMAAEMELASKSGDGLTISEDLREDCPLEIAFSIPGASKSHRSIRYEYQSEDANANGYLDKGEDTIVADGVLTRRVVRIERLEPGIDGKTLEVTTIVGGAHGISDVSIERDGSLVRLAVTASKRIRGTERVDSGSGAISADMVHESSRARVYLLN